MLDEAIPQVRYWADRYLQANLYISVNLSPVQLRDPKFSEAVQSVLNRWNVPACSLCLEVTERALMEYRERGIGALERLRNVGILLAFDDFGTGHSSLAYLRDLPGMALTLRRRDAVETVIARSRRRRGDPELSWA